MLRFFLCGLVLLLSRSGTAAGSVANPIPVDKDGVAWLADKRQFFFHQTPVGLNTDTRVGIVSGTAKGLWRVDVRIPLAAFHSGAAHRDKDVFKLLGGNEQPELLFRSTEMDAKLLGRLRDQGGRLEGVLNINGRESPVAFEVQGDGTAISGQAEVSLKALGLKAPRALMGVVFAVQDRILLFFRYKVASVEGASQIP